MEVIQEFLDFVASFISDGWSFGGTEAIALLLGIVLGIVIKESELRKQLGIPSDIETIPFIAALISQLGPNIRLKVLMELAEEAAKGMEEPDAITAAKAKAAKLGAPKYDEPEERSAGE